MQFLVKYFTQIGDTWQIAPEIRAMVQFRPLNLLADFSHLGMFDIVFCRNVLIYFDQETKTAVLDRIARVLDRDGYLVLGAAETVVGPDRELQADRRPARALCTQRRAQGQWRDQVPAVVADRRQRAGSS